MQESLTRPTSEINYPANVACRATSGAAAYLAAAGVADHSHLGPEAWIIDLLINTAVDRPHSPQSPVRRRRGLGEVSGGPGQERGCRMAAMKPRTGDGPLEVTKEGRGIVMRVPLEGGGRLVVELSADEAAQLSDALKSATG